MTTSISLHILSTSSFYHILKEKAKLLFFSPFKRQKPDKKVKIFIEIIPKIVYTYMRKKARRNSREGTEVAYTALYRKFRPDTFEEVKGQEAIVTTLKNQVKAGRTSHAYLFCGTRGTGKTSVAKLMARAVNCEHPVDGSPCNECDPCKAIAKGASMNVIEMDAASNNGVDDVRNIVEEVSYSPTEGKFKVYIIDEVHMLSTSAFNALLKTLEEPPSYVIFILATTDPQKLPVTILSRCQRYDFKRISREVIEERLKELLDREGVQAEEKAIAYVAKMADGAMRDALSLVDQCIAFYMGKDLTYENVLEVLGAVDTEIFSQFLRMLLDCRVAKSVAVLERIILDGRDVAQFVTDFTWYLRNLLLAKTSENPEEAIDMSAENFARLKEEADKCSLEQIIRYIHIFSELSNQIRYSSQKRVMTELAIVKLCKPQMERSYEALIERMLLMEEKIEQGIVLAAPEREEEKGEPKVKQELPKALPEEIRQIAANWRGIVEDASGLLQACIRRGKISLGDRNQLLLVFEDEFAYERACREDSIAELKELIVRRFEREAEVEMRLNQEGRRFEDSFIDLEKLILADIEIEED